MAVTGPVPDPMGQADLRDLEADRALLGGMSKTMQVADILRTRIAEGYFQPGARLPEDAIAGVLGISRNTLREAFRLLTHERLLVHELSRGVFVRRLSVDDVVDLYRVRRIIECAVVRDITPPPPDLSAVHAAVTAGQTAAAEHAWQDLGTANIRYHQAIAGLAGSPRINEIMRGLLAELRLVFHVMADPRRFHEPYLERNAQILHLLEKGDGRQAERLLADYLDDALAQLVAAYAEPSKGD